MPFAKAVLTRRQNRGPVNGTVACPETACPPSNIGILPAEEHSEEDLKDADQLFHNDLLSIGRQLSTLLLLAEQLFDELCGEYRLIGDRTNRLSSRINDLSLEKVDRLDAKAAEIPEGSISAVASLARHFETDYAYHGLAIFDPSNRPLSVQSLYGAALPTPVGHLRECDSYRTDDLRGAQIFSRIPIALNKWTDDLLSIAKARQKFAILPKRHVIRPLTLGLEAKSLPNILQTAAAEHGFDQSGKTIKAFESSHDVFTHNRERSLSPSIADDLQLPHVLLVNIDISGSGFSQLCKLHAPTNTYEVPADSFPTASLRRRDKFLVRPKTIGGISDLVFREIDIESPALKPSRSVKSRSSIRNPPNRTASQTLEIYAPKERRTPKDVKRRTRCFDDGDEPKSCGSWRHSLKSVFRLSRSKSRDLWNVTSVTNDVTRQKSSANSSSTLKRSMSLPRSLKSSTKHSTASFGSFRSNSVEGRLNFRVVQPSANNVTTDNTKSPKPVAGERLGRSLTKSLSQVRIGRSSRSRKSFDVPGRPQSMEIRMPSVDEDGRPLLSLYNNASVANVSSSTATVTSNSISDHPWMKSLSIIKLRRNENKDQKDDCQSSSGRWSGSSGLTEKQVVLESDGKQLTSLGSATLIGQCPSEMSVNIKDSAMCLHYNPNDSSFSPIDKKSEMDVVNAAGRRAEKFLMAIGGGKDEEDGSEQSNDNAFVERKVSRKSFISSNSLTRALSGRKKSSQPSKSDDKVIHGHPQHSIEINDEDCFPQKPSGDEADFRRSTKSDSSKPKTTYRSSFMLKLKKLGKSSSKAETPPSGAPTHPASRPAMVLTMGDCISQASNETGRSMTPSLPPGESNELKKLGELADRLAAAKAKASCTGALSTSLSSSSSSGSCVAWNRDEPNKTSVSLVLGEVNQMLNRGALCVLPSPSTADRYDCSAMEKSQGYVTNVVHFVGVHDAGTISDVVSTSADPPPVSPTKLELRPSIKILKMTELESILETSHECEAASPYLIRSKMAAIVVNENKNHVDTTTELDSQSDQSSIYDYADSTETNMVSPSNGKLSTSDQPLSSSPATGDSVEDEFITASGSLVPATARLIISSPLASRACFINNPFKRSLCQPLTTEDFTKLCAGDLELLKSPSSPDNSHFTYPEEVVTPSLDVLKHSAAFPVTIRERVDPSNYGRTWYDGIACEPLVPLVDVGEPSVGPRLGHPSFVVTSRSPNHNLKSTKDQTTGSSGYQNQNSLTYQKPDFQKPYHSFSTSSPTKQYDTPPGKANSQSTGQKGLAVSNLKSSQAGGVGKKCARVTFPSSNSGIPPRQSSHQTSSKPSVRTLQGDQKPRSTVNLYHLKTFRGADDTNLYLPSNGGGPAFKSDPTWSNFPLPNGAQGVKSNTLPRSHLKTFPESLTSHQLDLKCNASDNY